MPYQTGGEAMVASLLHNNIKTLFALPGVQNDWFFNALYDMGQDIRVIHTRHEQGAAYMATGYAMATGDIGVYSVVPGPGLLNSSAALSTAYALNAKVLCLTGQIPSHLIGKELGVLHEIEGQLELLRNLTKWSERAYSPNEVPHLLAEAFKQLNNGKPQPVGLEVPMDILAAKALVSDPYTIESVADSVDLNAVEEAAKLLGAAKNPMIFVGGGAQGVSPEVTALAEMLQAPVMGYRTGMGVVDARNYLSLHQPAAKKYWPKADVVISIGSNMRVPLQKWVKGHKPKVIRIDIDPKSHNKFVTPEIAITAYAEEALPHLLSDIKKHNIKRDSKQEELETIRAEWQKESAILEPQLSYLKVIREELGEDGIFVDELTQVGFTSRLTYPVYKPRTFISTGYQGTLGYGFPTALGVKVAKPDVPVLSIAGDGGFMFGVQDLATAVQHKIGLVTVIFNNNQYGNVQQMQKTYYDGRVIASDLQNPDFIKLAESFGAHAVQANTLDELRLAMREGFTKDLPTIIEVPVGDMPSIDQFR